MADAAPHPGMGSWGEAVRYAFVRLIDAVFSEKSPWFIIIIVTLLLVSQLGYILLLPEEQRAGVGSPAGEAASTIGIIIRSKTFHWLGWILFMLSTALCSAVIWIQRKRIESQGNRIRDMRNAGIQNRVSSRDPKTIEEYDERMKRRIGEDNDSVTH